MLMFKTKQNKKRRKNIKKHSKAIFLKKICCLNDVHTGRETAISKTLGKMLNSPLNVNASNKTLAFYMAKQILNAFEI